MRSKKHHSPETVKQIRDFLKYTKVAVVNIILLSLCYDVYDFIRNAGRMDLANVLFISATSSMVVFSAVAFDKDDFFSMSKIVISISFSVYTFTSIIWSSLFIYIVGKANQIMASSYFEPIIKFIVNFLRYVFPSVSLQMVFIYILFVVYKLIMHRDQLN